MKKKIAVLIIYPLHVWLLPLYFIISKYVQFAGLLDDSESLIALIKLLAGFSIGFFLFYLLLKNYSKSGIVVTYLGCIYLFFGAIKQLLTVSPVLHYISPYRILLPLLFILSIGFLYRIKKWKRLARITLFLNLLFSIYLGIELYKWIETNQKNSFGLKNSGFDYNMPIDKNASLNRVNIYYIVLDCHPSAAYQEEMLGVKNNLLDSSLLAKGFYVLDHPRSNYTKTSFSMAATFTMDYLPWLKTNHNPYPYEYNRAMSLVKNSPVLELLHKYGYQLHNLSIFDLPGKPSIQKGKFLSTTTTQMIFFNTLWNSFIRDVMWKNSAKKWQTRDVEKVYKNKYEFQKGYNKKIIDSLLQFAENHKNEKPYFVYAHLLMPHFPYFYNKSGIAYPDEEIYTDSLATDRDKFRNYIVYTDSLAIRIVDSLFKQGSGKDVIIIQSDHGLSDLNESRKQDAFRNISAFYFPDKEYKPLYNEMSNVNTFRVILNKYFNQKLALLKDSSIYIK
ncbi:MAG: hypothetical protein JWO92_1571 [Chitinophagaceae bacterium]|nr:hypothetical protein [Chitinophagaceae bacterium]